MAVGTIVSQRSIDKTRGEGLTDRVSKEKRSQIMSRIRGKNTAPELAVRKLVFSLGYRYRLHDKRLPGRPDLVFIGLKKVIFVHGCFWHQHPDCLLVTTPKTRVEFWIKKLSDNTTRDAINIKKITDMGWKSLIVWQCEIKDTNKLKEKIKDFLRN
jgi:DNA mismatch endonuclease (patch repair protein)